MRVTFYEVTRLCFVVSLFLRFIPSKDERRHIYVFCSMYMWICYKEDVGSSSLLSERFFGGVLAHSWGVEESLPSLSTAQHMLAIMWFIYSTSQGSTKTVPLWGDNLKGRGGPGKHLHLFHGRSCQKIATSRYRESSRHRYKSLWLHFIISHF